MSAPLRVTRSATCRGAAEDSGRPGIELRNDEGPRRIAAGPRAGCAGAAGGQGALSVPRYSTTSRISRRESTVAIDGMLEGPDLEEVRRVSDAVRGRVLYSGGIGSLDDLVGLRSLRLLNLAGVIYCKAL